MNNDKLLDQYIDERFSDCKTWLTDEQRKAISETSGFAFYCLHDAVEQFKLSIKAEFSWLFGEPK